MPSKKCQKNRELKRATQSCSKLSDIFKKSKPSEEPNELSANENQNISNVASEG